MKKTIDEQMLQVRKRLGKDVEVEEGIEEDDRLLIKAIEKKPADGQKQHETGFTLLVSMIKDDDVKQAVLGGKKGDKFEFNVRER